MGMIQNYVKDCTENDFSHLSILHSLHLYHQIDQWSSSDNGSLFRITFREVTDQIYQSNHQRPFSVKQCVQKMMKTIERFLFLLFLFDKHQQPRLFFWACSEYSHPSHLLKERPPNTQPQIWKGVLGILFFCQIVWPLFRGGMG